jgi:hypothetical protein
MAITKPAVRQSWANVAIPVTDIVDPGDAYVAAGWQESATPPSRQYFNWLLNYASNGIVYLIRRGVSDYDAAETYQIGDTVLGDAGILMQSLTAGNIGNQPSTSPTNWGPLNNYPNATQVASAISTALAAYVTNVSLAATLANYVTTATLSATLAAYVTNTSLATTLTSYATLAALSLKSNTFSPIFTGIPAAPTATVGTNTTQLATTAFAQGVLSVAQAYTNSQIGVFHNGGVNGTSDALFSNNLLVRFGFSPPGPGSPRLITFPAFPNNVLWGMVCAQGAPGTCCIDITGPGSATLIIGASTSGYYWAVFGY